MARGRSGVISKEYKGEDNTAYHDVIKLFKIYRVVDLIEISTQSKHSGNIQLINNSDKRDGNTLLLSSQSYKNEIKSHSI